MIFPACKPVSLVRQALASMAAGLLLVFAQAAPAQQASGAFASQYGTIEPRYAYAFPYWSDTRFETEGIAVLLSEAPVDVAAASASLKPYGHAKNQLTDASYLTLFIEREDGALRLQVLKDFNADADKFDNEVTLDLDDTFAQHDGIRYELGTWVVDDVVGRTWTRAPYESSFDGTLNWDLEFDAPVMRPIPGKPLATDGGEAGATFLALLPAAREALKVAREAKTEEGREVDLLTYVFARTEPESVSVVGGTLRDKQADLQVVIGYQFSTEAGSFDTARLFLVRMTKDTSEWVYKDLAEVSDAYVAYVDW